MPRTTLDRLTTILAGTFAPLRDALSSKDQAEVLLNSLGWELPPGVDDIGLTALNVKDLVDKLAALRIAMKLQGDDSSQTVALQADVAIEVVNFVNHVRQFVQNLPATLSTSYLAKTQIDKQLLKRLTDFLITRFFEENVPFAFYSFAAIGIFELEPIPADRDSFQSEHVRRTVKYDRIGLLLTDPQQLIQDVYGWGTPNLKTLKILAGLGNILQALGVPAKLGNLPRRVEEKVTGSTAPLADTKPLPQLNISLLKGLGWNPLDIGLAVYGLRPTSDGGTDGGLALSPYIKGDTRRSFEIRNNLFFEVGTELNVQRGVALSLRPGKPVSLQMDLTGSGGAVTSGKFSLGLVYRPPADQPVALLELPAGTRLDVKEVGLSAGASIVGSGKFGAFTEFDLKGLRFRLGGGQGDGFLNKILPADGMQVEFALTLGISSDAGFYFRGSSALEVELPIHVGLGPLDIQALYLALRLGGGRELPLEISTLIKAELGPLKVAVERFGILLKVSFPPDGGNVGPLDIKPAFKPPNGVGLAVDADPVVGGGYLEFDPDNERYAGILQLGFGEIDLMAIGLITTRMPDGSKGFSMLLIITAEFDPPITLPYNFNLSGVGGLVGIHRTMLVDVIRQGLKNRTIDSILFPEDPILNAPRIISDLRAVFPPTEGRYVIGPMAILNWGNPALVRAEIGILIEIPSPVRIAILGQLTLELPKERGNTSGNESEEESVLIEIHIDLLGVIDFDKKTFSFDATLYDSRIAKFTLSGDSAMRLSWGDNPNFALSVGGLHPRFTPPPNFPTLNRLQLSIGSGNNPRISLNAYMAVTSNSTQFGARLEVIAKKAGFTLQGYMGFDVLFIFSPFSFTADIGAGVAVKMGSTTLLTVTLDLTLSGPKPWHAHGKATFKVVVKKVKVRFDKAWGSGQPDPLPAIDPWPRLKAALDDPGNWGARLPAGSQIAVTLRQPGVAAPSGTSAAPSGNGAGSNGSGTNPDLVVVHPIGGLEIRQRVLPFNLEMDLYGNAPIAGDTSYSVAKLWTGPGEPDDSNSLDINYGKEQFARAQFESLPDSEKLSLPSFEKFDAAILLSTGQVTSGAAVNYPLEYETEVIDENRVTQKAAEDQGQGVSWDAAQYYLKGGAAQVAVTRVTGLQAYAPFGEAKRVILAEEDYKVVRTADLALETDIKQNGSTLTHAEASRLLRNHLAANPQKKGQLQVVPSYEVVA